MKISTGIEMLEISTVLMDKPDKIFPTLFADENNIILVDTGYPGQLARLQEVLSEAGFHFDKLTKIIITHHDIDHIGGLSSILKESSQKIEVFAHAEEKPYIQGEKKAVKLAALEANLDSLPQQMIPIFEGFKRFYSTNKSTVDKTLSDGEILPYCGGIKIIYTPGHTPGHICLYHIQSKTLIAGDMLGIENGVLIKAAANTNYDKELASESLEKLAHYDIEAVICYHGGLYKGDVNQRIIELTLQ